MIFYKGKKLLGKFINKISIKNILIIFLIFAFTLNSLWVIIDRSTPKGPGLNLISRSVTLYKDYKNNDYSQFKKDLLRTNPDKTDTPPSPLISFNFLLFYILFGLNTGNELFINSFYLVLLLFSVYKIGEHIYDKKTGLLATIIMSSFYIILLATRRTYLEFYLLCLISLCYLFLLKTNFLKNRKYSIYFAIILSLTSLVKYTFILFILPQFLIYILYSFIHNLKRIKWKKIIKDKKPVILNVIIIFVIFSFISSIWYIPSFSILRKSISNRMTGLEEPGRTNYPILSYENSFYYFFTLVNYYIGVLYFILLLFSVIFLLIKFKNIKFNEVFLIISFILSYLFLTYFIPIKGIFLLLPAILPIPILISYFLLNNNLNKLFKMALIVFIIMYSIYNYSIPFQENLPELYYQFHPPKIEQVNYLGEHDSGLQDESYYKKLLFNIVEDFQKRNQTQKPNIVFLSETSNLPFHCIQYYLEIYDLNFTYHFEYTEDFTDWNVVNIKSGHTHDQVLNLTSYIMDNKPAYVVLQKPQMNQYSYEFLNKFYHSSFFIRNSHSYNSEYKNIFNISGVMSEFYPHVIKDIMIYRNRNI